MKAEELHDLFVYDAENGGLKWKVTRSQRVPAGHAAGSVTYQGYLRVGVRGRSYQVHRLVWAMHNGDFPPREMQVDHIDGNRANNRIENLRLCDNSENHQNIGPQRNNASGFMGVNWDERNKRWRASICVNRKRIRVGDFDTPEAAHEAYLQAKKELHGFQPTPRAILAQQPGVGS